MDNLDNIKDNLKDLIIDYIKLGYTEKTILNKIYTYAYFELRNLRGVKK